MRCQGALIMNPWWLQHVEFQHRKRIENKSAGSVSLPRSLAIKVANVKYKDMMDMCTSRGQFLAGCNLQFISALMLKFKVHYLMLGEEIAKKVRIRPTAPLPPHAREARPALPVRCLTRPWRWR